MVMTAEEALNYLEEVHVIEPTYADPKTEDALQLIRNILTLVYDTLTSVEWQIDDEGGEFCLFCGVYWPRECSATCPRQLVLTTIRKE